ncbi:hypothetical protein M2399_003004 [Pseudomonas sp. BIGb0450]|nr:hypothetical protein [Pseudomonas sp. BIGb0558]MCS3437562.1 hypothetical protein [Pseudomonas sp. BIGb0450]
MWELSSFSEAAMGALRCDWGSELPVSQASQLLHFDLWIHSNVGAVEL